jgi:hypothetical protein
MNWKRAVEIVGLILAVAALIVGLVHLQEISRMQASLSTRYIGEFPDFLDEIIGIVQSAHRDINILCDFPAYGNFDDPTRSARLRDLIRLKLHQGVKVRLVCLDHERRRLALSLQFPSAPAPYKTREAFIDDFEAKNEAALKQTYGDANVLQVNAELPVFFWIADRRRGVLVVQTFGGNVEYGFASSDLALMRAL